MKQLLILSGKGGTGKTTIAAAFIKLANSKAFADCDVDAPNLHLVMCQASESKNSDYRGMDKAFIDKDKCIGCDVCRMNCRFNAISKTGKVYAVNSYACEGCGLCEVLCPVKAVSMQPHIAGELQLYNDEIVFSTARLKMGSGTSGKLVTEVKKQLQHEIANSVADSTIESDLIIIDGSPGIGCPVIASLSGVDMVLIVSEPSLSGISDMERIIKTAGKFQIKTTVCINKYDTNYEYSEKIEALCRENNIPFAGKIPFDAEAVKAINNGKSVVEVDCEAGRALKRVFDDTMKILNT